MQTMPCGGGAHAKRVTRVKAKWLPPSLASQFRAWMKPLTIMLSRLFFVARHPPSLAALHFLQLMLPASWIKPPSSMRRPPPEPPDRQLSNMMLPPF